MNKTWEQSEEKLKNILIKIDLDKSITSHEKEKVKNSILAMIILIENIHLFKLKEEKIEYWNIISEEMIDFIEILEKTY